MGKTWTNKNNLIEQTQTVPDTIQNLQFQVLCCPITKQFWLLVWTVKFIFVLECVARAIPLQFIWFYQLFIYRRAIIFQVFHFSILYFASKLAFFVLLAKYSAFTSFAGTFWSSLWPKFLRFTQFLSIFFTPIRVFFENVIFWRTNTVSVNILIKKNSSSLLTFLSACSISSTKQEIVFQKSTNLKMEIRTSFL